MWKSSFDVKNRTKNIIKLKRLQTHTHTHSHTPHTPTNMPLNNSNNVWAKASTKTKIPNRKKINSQNICTNKRIFFSKYIKECIYSSRWNKRYTGVKQWSFAKKSQQKNVKKNSFLIFLALLATKIHKPYEWIKYICIVLQKLFVYQLFYFYFESNVFFIF